MATGFSSDILETLVSRLCHDLAGPLSAVSNGLELVGEMGAEPGDDALALVESSAATAVARLQFFRLAFGQAGGRAPMAFAEMRSVAEGMLAQSHASLEIADPDGLAVDEPAGLFRAVLGTVFVANDAMPRGGVIRVLFQKGAVIVTAVPATGSLKIDGFSAGSFGPRDPEFPPTPGPRSAPVCAMRLLADASSVPLALEGDENGLSITLATG